MSAPKPWAERSPEEREQIQKNREAASYNNPFSGKNQAQRQRLLHGYMAMSKKY